MPGNIRLYGTTGYVELAAPATGNNATLTLPTDSIQPGLVLITHQTFSSVSSVPINNCFSSTYKNYRLIFSGNASASVSLSWRLRASGSDITGNSYYWQRFYIENTTSAGTYQGPYTSDISNWGIDTGVTSVVADIFNPYAVERTHYVSLNHYNGATSGARFGGGVYYANTQADGINIYPSSGTFSGNISIYGYKNS